MLFHQVRGSPASRVWFSSSGHALERPNRADGVESLAIIKEGSSLFNPLQRYRSQDYQDLASLKLQLLPLDGQTLGTWVSGSIPPRTEGLHFLATPLLGVLRTPAITVSQEMLRELLERRLTEEAYGSLLKVTMDEDPWAEDMDSVDGWQLEEGPDNTTVYSRR